MIEQRNYPKVVHRRTILFVRSHYFVILDALEAEERHQYAQLFHLSPRLCADLEGRGVRTASLANGPTIEILPLLETGLTVKLHKPHNDATHGWVCVAEKEKVGNTVAEYRRSGESEEFGVLLVPQPAGASNRLQAKIEESSHANDRHICVIIGDRQDEIFMSPTGKVTIESVKL